MRTRMKGHYYEIRFIEKIENVIISAFLKLLVIHSSANLRFLGIYVLALFGSTGAPKPVCTVH